MNEFVRMVLSNNLTATICILTLCVFVAFLVGILRIIFLSVKFRRIKTIDAIKTEKYTARIFKKYETTIVFPDKEGKMKTDEEADIYFNLGSILSEIRINHR